MVSRLKTQKRTAFSSQRILDMICDEEGKEMIQALVKAHQDASKYENVLQRLSCESGFTVNERAEMAMVLLVTAGCTANVSRAASQVIEAPRDQRDMNSETETVVPIHPGDELLLASNTRFIVLEGIPKR